MRSRGAVLDSGDAWEVVDLDLGEPQPGEVLVRFAYAGLCHSDEHLRASYARSVPLVGGHEGAGIVEAVGPGVSRVRVGDHVVVFVVPSCGGCRWCSVGRPVLCTTLSNPEIGYMRDGTFRFSLEGRPIGAHCMLGTFSQYAVVLEESCVPVDAEAPLQIAALVSCAVVTGWGAVVHAGETRVGDTVMVIGTGGVGVNAVQAAALAGAANVIAVDPVAFKREIAAKCGATHQVASVEEAAAVARALNPSAGGADVTVIASGTTSEDLMTQAFAATGRGGTIVVVGLGADFNELNIRLSASQLAVSERRIQGCLMGSSNFVRDIPMIIAMYQSGRLSLDHLVSNLYPLESINTGFADMLTGRTIRGLIAHVS